MEKIRLGKTEMMVSKLGFGGIPIQRLSDDEAVNVVKRCLDLGITYLDTANNYTTSEERIGKAIAGRREQLIIATKSQSRDREGVEKNLELSLERLGVEYIDLYQFHGVSDSKELEAVLDPDGPMAAVQDAKKAGVIRHIGISSHQIDVAKDAVKTGLFETMMFPFNFIVSEPGSELLTLCREHDVGFIAMKPLAGGMLENVDLAFKYLFQFPDVVPIPGIEETREIEEIMQILEGPHQLTEEDEREIQRLRDELGTRFCRRCDYCQPCTADIPISMVMISKTFYHRIPLDRFFSRQGKALEKATECTECGECEERCPYHLPIREMMKEMVALYQEEKKKYEEQIAAQ